MKATLTYHSVDDSGSPISVPIEAFQRHLRWLAGGRVRVLTLSELCSHPADGPDAVAVSFDDGFLNVRGILDQMADQGLPATVFVVSGHVGATNAWGGRDQHGIPTLPLLGWDDLEYLGSRGVAIESHTRSHCRLTTVSSPMQDEEIQGCRDDLRARLGVESAHVAYPYGNVDNAVASQASKVFSFGHTTDFRAMEVADEVMRLPRLDMYYFRTPGALEAWGSPAFARRVAWVRLRRTIRAGLPGLR